MVEIEKIMFNRDKDIFNMMLVSLSKEDINLVRNFILKQHYMLEREDFFIIEDLDTELPLIFEENKGCVYGIFLNNKLVAMQAIDFNSENDTILRPHVQIFLDEDCHIYEMGWTLVDQEFRGCHIAEYLLKYVESQINDSRIALVATVHPENTRALKLYLKNGFIGYTVSEYYGYCRMFLIKTSLLTNINLGIDNGICVEFTNLKKIKEMLDKQYACVGIIKKKEQYFLQLKPTKTKQLIN